MKFERILETYFAFAPLGFKFFIKSMPVWVRDKLFQKHLIIKYLKDAYGKHIDWDKKLLFSEHHFSHAASAFFPSPFKRSAVLTLDGVGEWATTTLAVGNDASLKIIKEIHFPHSLGLFYSSFTYYLGFKVNSGEYKVMGLAPYGNPIYVDLIYDNLIDVKEDGSFALNLDYFNYCTGDTMTNKRFDSLFGGPVRERESELTERHLDIAASVQKVTEDIVLKLGRWIATETKEKNLCLAGGVTLNCVANGVLLKEGIFENIWIQPAAGDAGGSVGAAYAAYYVVHGHKRVLIDSQDSMSGAFLGPQFLERDIRECLTDLGACFERVSDNEVIEVTANALAIGKAVGWMKGRMEFGPRALGSRSIIADPRSPLMQQQLNLKVKYRESFRPFAPSILREHLEDWFELDVDSPYMLLVAKIAESRRLKMSSAQSYVKGLKKLKIERSVVPAVTHVDFSSRIQTVHRDTNPTYYALIQRFHELTGCPLVVNTSFNRRGEPIVCTPEDSFKCFMNTDLDLLVIENFVLYKENQNSMPESNYLMEYDLD